MTATPSLRIAFFGSGEFALPTLERLVEGCGPHRLVGVFSRPARPAGRGRKPRSTPVAERAGELGVECHTPPSVGDPDVIETLDLLAADLFVVADYGELLRQQFRRLPRIGAYNLHGSLLPKYRGAAPVVHALLAGEAMTGVTLFRIVKALDSGPVVAARELEVGASETAGALEARLARLAAELLVETLEAFARGTFAEAPQDHSQATLAPKIKKTDALLDWTQSAQAIERRVRALQPSPGAYSFLRRSGKGAERTVFVRVRALPPPLPAARHRPRDTAPGEVCAVGKDSFHVACGEGEVEVLEIQRAGKAALTSRDYLRGSQRRVGDRFSPHAGAPALEREEHPEP